MRRTIHLACALGALTASLAWAPTAGAQGICDPSQEVCQPNPPSIGISPPTQRTDSLELDVRVSWSDLDGLAGSTHRILVNGSAVSWPVIAHSSGTSAYAEGRVPTRADASNSPTVVLAEITDAQGNTGSHTATYTWNAPPPPPPGSMRDTLRISVEPFHSGFRDVSMGSASLSYAMPSYVSMGQERSYGAVYLSGQAFPHGFLQVDVTDVSAEQAPVYSLQVVDAQGARMVLQNGQTEMFFSRPAVGPARLAAQWDMKTAPSGAYKFRAVVRAHWPDGTAKESSAEVRVLIVNESAGPFGRGWSMPGLHRLYPRDGDGVMIAQGDGTAWFFENSASCTAQTCTYVSPNGDLSTLRKLTGPDRYERTYSDGTIITYASWGGITTVIDRFGNRTWYDWGSVNGTIYPTGVTDPAGKAVVFLRTDAGSCGGCRIAGFVDPGGRRTVVTHDASGNVTAVTAPDNTPIFRNAAYSLAGALTGWIDSRGGQWNLTYSRLHLSAIDAPAVTVNGVAVRPRTGFRPPQVAAMRFNASTTVQAPAPGLSRDSVWARTVDPEGHATIARLDRWGNAVESRSPTGDVTTATYDPTGRPRTVVAQGRQTEYTYDGYGGVAAVSENGQPVYAATRTLFGQPRSITQGGRTTWFSYTNNGVLVRSWTGGAQDADSLSKATNYTFDSRGRLTAVATPDGLRSETFYQAAAWMNVEASRVRKRVADSTTWVSTYYGYDGHGRNYRVVGPDGATETEFDALNRPVKTTDPAGGITSFGYTGPDLTRVTDAASKVYRWSHDVLGRQLTETDPQGRTRSFGYNRDGMVTQATDRRGLTVTSAYDAGHRVSQVTADNQTTTYSYVRDTGVHWARDPGRVIARNGVSTDTIQGRSMTPVGWERRRVHVLGGRRYEVRNLEQGESGLPSSLELTAYANGAQSWHHTAGRVHNFAPANAAYGYETSYENFAHTSVTQSFRKEGGLSRTTYPNGVQRYHSYDTHRRAAGVSFNSGPLHGFMGGEYQYDYMSRLAAKTFQGDTANVYSYDPLGRLKALEVLRYSYVPHLGCNPSTQTCGMDTVATRVRLESFTYDAVGNRTDRAAGLEPGSNRYTTFDGWSLTYDDEGNLVRKFKQGVMDQVFTWNALGQLASVTTNGQTTRYGYNGFGERVKRENAQTGAVVWYLYNDGDLLMELDGLGTPIRSYRHAGTDNPLSVTFGDPRSGPTYYYVNEQPGHVRALMTPTGGFANKYVYQPFGARADGTSEGVQQPLQFMGRERDELTGIYYVRARWYDADLGRFVSEDPIGLSGGINTYAYANNDPINLRDPSGLWAECPDGYIMAWDGTCYSNAPILLDEVVVGRPKNPFTLTHMQLPNMIFSADTHLGTFDRQRAVLQMILNSDVASQAGDLVEAFFDPYDPSAECSTEWALKKAAGGLAPASLIGGTLEGIHHGGNVALGNTTGKVFFGRGAVSVLGETAWGTAKGLGVGLLTGAAAGIVGANINLVRVCF